MRPTYLLTAAAAAVLAAAPASALTFVSATTSGGNTATPIEVGAAQASIDFSIASFSPITANFQVDAGDAAAYGFDSFIDIFTGVGPAASGVASLVLSLSGGATFVQGVVSPAFSTAISTLNAERNRLTISFTPAETSSVTLGSLNDGIGDFLIQRDGLAAGQSFALNVSPSDVAAVPEPATWLTMAGGIGLVGGAMRRTRRRATAHA